MALFPENVAPRNAVDDLRGERNADDPGAEAQDVQVVVLDGLMRRVGVVADGGTDPWKLVRGD